MAELMGRYQHRPRRPPEQRFWEKVDRRGPLSILGTECWVWIASFNGGGYGQLRGVNSERVDAHVFSYRLHHGPIPSGMRIDHQCLNRACVRPEHLRLATHKQNLENREGLTRNNTSGVRGVHWSKRWGKWVARVTHYGSTYSVGYFDDLADAAEAVRSKRNELFTHNQLDRAV